MGFDDPPPPPPISLLPRPPSPSPSTQRSSSTRWFLKRRDEEPPVQDRRRSEGKSRGIPEVFRPKDKSKSVLPPGPNASGSTSSEASQAKRTGEHLLMEREETHSWFHSLSGIYLVRWSVVAVVKLEHDAASAVSNNSTESERPEEASSGATSLSIFFYLCCSPDVFLVVLLRYRTQLAPSPFRLIFRPLYVLLCVCHLPRILIVQFDFARTLFIH
jgi:hypothetical protein